MSREEKRICWNHLNFLYSLSRKPRKQKKFLMARFSQKNRFEKVFQLKPSKNEAATSMSIGITFPEINFCK